MSGDLNRIMAMIEEKHGWRSDRTAIVEAGTEAAERSEANFAGSSMDPVKKIDDRGILVGYAYIARRRRSIQIAYQG